MFNSKQAAAVFLGAEPGEDGATGPWTGQKTDRPKECSGAGSSAGPTPFRPFNQHILTFESTISPIVVIVVAPLLKLCDKSQNIRREQLCTMLVITH